MARAKKIIRKSEKETLKERRKSGEFKQDKKDARASGLSRGEARKRAKRLSRVQALANRKSMRADMAAKRNEDASVSKMFADRRRKEAKRGGQKLAYDVAKPLSPAKQRENAPGGTPTKRLKGNENVSFDDKKGMYKIVGADGYVRYSKSKPAMYGAKVKAVKKAKNGGKITDPPKKGQTLAEKNLKEDVDTMGFKMKGFGSPKDAESAKIIAKSDNIKPNKVTVKGEEKGYGPDNDYRRKEDVKKFSHEYNMKNDSKYRIAYKKKLKAQYDAEDAQRNNNNKKTVKTVKKAKAGAALKSVPSKSKGLSKLPKGVRNKMGYMQEGGKVKSKSVGVLKSDTNKAGPKMESGKEPYTKNGINYTWDRKNSVWRGDADKGLNKKPVAVKKK